MNFSKNGGNFTNYTTIHKTSNSSLSLSLSLMAVVNLILKGYALLRGHPPKRSRQPGFTLVELLIVIVVIAILAAITVVAYNGITAKANIASAQSAAEQAGEKIAIYTATNSDQVPPDLATAGLTNSGSTSYQYTPNTTVSPQTYCLTATVSTASYSVATGGTPTAGPCPGHTGTAPTTLADGSSCPTGYIVVPGSSLYGTNAFCVMKYDAKNDGSGNAVSTAAGSPWVNISQTTAISTSAAACSGCHLITEAEWLTIAQNVTSVASNWSGGSVGSGYIYSGHNDNAPANALAADTNDSNGYYGETNTGGNQRRTLTLTNGNVIWDMAGNVWQWTSGTTTGGQPGSPGFAWRQYYPALVNYGTLAVNPYPGYALPNGATWTSGNGIGQLYSASDDTGARGFLRGGHWGYGGIAGVWALILSNSPSGAYSYIGFRVSR